MDFSHLEDTKFPNLETASPYALKNTFDYTRWVTNTKVHLVNVLWNDDYSNVVKFNDDAARDAWFDGISDSYTLTLKSNARIVPDGTIKLPLPYDVAARYNYLYIEIPLATSREQFIQNENDSGVRRWYFFVGDVSYSAPNTTIVAIQPDVWTNFIDSSRITYMMLQRGHAPVYASDTDTYLANPISNNRYLLAPDVNYDDSSVVRDSKYIPFGNGTKYVCLASTVGYSQIQNGESGVIHNGPSFTNPTFSNTSDWYGNQLQVNGYQFGNGKDMSNLKACVNPYNRPGNIVPSSLDVYAFPARDDTFIADVMNQSPAFMRTVQAMFIVDESMISLGANISFCGHSMWFVTGRESTLGNYELDKGMFSFDSDEQRFAKLFTYPYSRIEVSDNSGKTVEVRIENTGKIGMRLLTSVAFPVLDFRVFLTGINGVGSQSYTWLNLGNDELNKLMPNGDWDKLTFELGIPTYSIYMDSETAYMLDNYSKIQNAREQALTAYHNSVRSANSSNTNAKALASTANSNANDSANTAQTNSNAMAGTTKTNTVNFASANYSNTGLTMTANTANANAANATSSNIMTETNTMAQWDNNDANLIIQNTTREENEVTTSTTANTAEENKQTSVASGAVSGAMAGGGGVGSAIGAAAGGVLGYVTSSISADCATANSTIITQANSSVADATTNANSNKVSRHTLGSQNNTGYMNDNRTSQANNNNAMLNGQRTNTRDAADTNASNLYNTQTANSARTCNTEVTNAGRTLTTSNDNANRTREIAILNAQETLICAQDPQRYAYEDARRGAPIKLTSYTGDAANWAFGQNGIQFRLRTQSDSAIAQTASQFARFGYTLNQLWDVQSSGLNLMKNFTYWQASDVWVDVRNIASSDVGDMISNMFRNGVTVWSDPDKIGKVGIYDN